MKDLALNNTKSLVSTVYYQMFQLRLMGLTYPQIAGKTGYSEDHVKHIFAKGGVLYELWQEWKRAAKENSLEEALDLMFGHLPDIARANVVDAKQTNSPVGIAARKMIFDYTLGKPEEKLKVNAQVGIYTVADLIKAATIYENEQRDNGKNQGEVAEKAN
jgi:hypothetical protein